MDPRHDPTEATARHLINERVARASEPRLPRTTRRRRAASSLRRMADRLDPLV